MSIWGNFSKATKKDELVLVFDIGSSSVKAALLRLESSGVPRIVACVREPIQLEDKVDIDRFLVLILKSLAVVAEKISKTGLGAPTKIFCIFASPWHISQTRVISMKKDTPFIFTSKIADELIQKEIALINEQYIQKYAHVGNTLRPIDLKNIKTLLNGYETSQPLNKKAKELEMIVYISMSEDQVCKKIEETVAKYFSLREIKFSSFTMSSFAVVRDLYAHQENFLLVNIGGEITDISMVKNSTLREATSFPMGINFMIRSLASSMHATLPEAKSLFALFKEGHAADSASKSLEPIITKLKNDWLAKFQESLANLSTDISIPALVYITVDKDLADFFREVIKTEQFNQYTLTESKFQIIFLNVENLRDIAVFERNVAFNASIAIDSVYINRFLNRIAL